MYKFLGFVTKISMRIVFMAKKMSISAMIEIVDCKKLQFQMKS